jgi:hypothetical protein
LKANWLKTKNNLPGKKDLLKNAAAYDTVLIDITENSDRKAKKTA